MTPSSTSGGRSDSRLDRQLLIGIVLGVWAAAFGLAPDLASKLLVLAPVVIGAVVWWSLLLPDRWLAIFFVCALLLPPLPSAIGNSGIHVAALILPIGLLAGALHARQWRASRSILPLLFGCFLLALIVSVAFAAFYSGWSIALGSFARVLLFSTGAYVFVYTLAGPRQPGADPMVFARLLFWLALLGAAFACVDFYFQFPAPAGYAPQFAWIGQTVVRRAQGVFYEASTLGNFCAFFLTMILVSFFSPHGWRMASRYLLLFGALVFGAALILSSSRASMLAVLVAGGAFLWLRRAHITRILVASCAAVAAAAMLVRFLLPAFSTNYWLRIVNSIQYLGQSPNGVLSGRIATWQALTSFLLQKPWHLIFGIGYKTLPYTDYVGRGLVADNTYLSLLVETGLVGLLAFVTLNVAILRAAYTAARSSHGRAAYFGAWIFCFWCGEIVQMFSGDLITYWRVLPVYFWVLATAVREAGD